LGYLLGNLYLKGIDPNRSQSRGIDEIVSLVQELCQLKKPPNRVRFKGYLGHPTKFARNHPQNSAKKSTTKSSKNHHKEGREKHFTTLRNNVEPSIHTMKVHTRSSLPPIHPSLSLSLSLDLT
jgi:hypothetical protein